MVMEKNKMQYKLNLAERQSKLRFNRKEKLKVMYFLGGASHFVNFIKNNEDRDFATRALHQHVKDVEETS